MSRSSACSSMAKTFGFNENGAILVFWLHVKNVQKGMFLSDSARLPHRTAKASRECLPLAHPRALPSVIPSDRRSPSAMCEFPFECLGCGSGSDSGQAPVYGRFGVPPGWLGLPQVRGVACGVFFPIAREFGMAFF